MLVLTLLAGALLLQNPAETAAPVPSAEGLANGSPQWFATPPNISWGFQNFGPRLGVQHRSQGYGYDRGYTSLESFVPLLQVDFQSLTGVEGNLLIDNGGEFGGNVGLIQRLYSERWDRVFGVNVFYDHRQEDGSGFHQIGCGVESLGTYLDGRLNGYFPVGDDVFVAEGGGITSAEFSGRQILVNFVANKALTGFDSELGGVIPGTRDLLRGYAGMYHFWGDLSDDVTGVQARLEARWQNSVLLHMGLTNDGTFGTNFVLGAGVYWGGFAAKHAAPTRAAGRLADKIYRNQNIIIDRSPLPEPVPARWVDGTVIDVVHVNSAAAGPQSGAVDEPFATLTAAQGAAAPGSLLFVHANSAFNGEAVVLQDRQQLLGEGIEHHIVSLYGSFVLPTVTNPEDVLSVPLIANAPGTAVTVANDTVVSGFRIFNAAGDGVAGTNVANVALDELSIQNAGGAGVDLFNAAGNLAVANSFVLNNADDGVAIVTALSGQNTLRLSDNTILGNAGEGIELVVRGDTDNLLVLERNLVRVVLGPTDTRSAALVQIDALNNSRLSARIENNTLDDTFLRDDTSPDEDPYYMQLAVNAWNHSRLDVGFLTNTLESDRRFLLDQAANGSFGIAASSNDVAQFRARFDGNTSDLNYGMAENFTSVFQLEDTLATNSGTFFYFPTAVFFDVIPAGTIPLP
uniref:Inverse autotransporter beta-domain domain-containing protein n=1 Tax=Schlesneria paludicola TaxID=360056 RepID=A0A7C4LPI7_9PLAN